MTTTTEEKEEFTKKMRKGGRGITLKFDGVCADCGAFLAKGTTARWYGRGRIYGYTCHTDARPTNPDLPSGKVESKPAQGDLFSREIKPDPKLDLPAEIDAQPDTDGEFVPKQYNCTIG